jgi:valyl-tRNA synthetase
MYAILKGLAPILPHITEEIYSVLFSYKGEKTIHIGGWPVVNYRDPLSEQAGEAALEVISAMRKWKQENQLGLGTKLKSLVISHPEPDLLYEAKSEIAGTARSLMLEIKKGDSCAVVSGETLE